MSVRFAILVPSAEGKQPGGNPLAPDMFDYRSSNTFNYFSELNPERRTLINALQAQLREADEAALDKLFSLKGDALREATEADLDVYRSPLMAAIDRYGPGVMYGAMEFASLPTGAQRRLLENGVIFSGMFGLLRPDDLIPNYRLRMEASVEGLGRVARYWRPHLSPLLNGLLRGKVVWNLLPAAHEEAWEDDRSYARMYRVKFFREEGGERKAVTHGVKELRGNLVNYVVTELADGPDAIEDWEAPGGYELDRDASELDEKGGTLVMVTSPGWEARREARRQARAEAAAERRPRREDGDEDEE
jgi:uncharacterized protein